MNSYQILHNLFPKSFGAYQKICIFIISRYAFRFVYLFKFKVSSYFFLGINEKTWNFLPRSFLKTSYDTLQKNYQALNTNSRLLNNLRLLVFWTLTMKPFRYKYKPYKFWIFNILNSSIIKNYNLCKLQPINLRCYKK